MSLTRPKSELRPRYDAVVVGSGYGGGVAALRLAEAGWSVAVFERGREHPPSTFPARTSELLAEVQVRADVDGRATHVGSHLGLFDVRVHQGLSAIVGCGVGGTSLINASVFCAPDDALFDDARWPRALRLDADGRRAALARTERLLLPTTAGPEVAKTRFMRHLGDASGLPAKRLPLVVIPPGENDDGAPDASSLPCNGCGNCTSGCRRGAKRSVDATYLAAAVARGAMIFSELDVRWVERQKSGWAVHYDAVCRPVGTEREASFVVGDVVVLAAGALGSTEILARSKALGLAVSDALGTAFSGNGNGVGLIETAARGVRTVAPRSPEGGEPGPCITMSLDVPADGPPVHLEDGTAPSVLAGLLRTTGLVGRARDTLDRAASPARGIAAVAKEAIVTALESSLGTDDGAQLVLLQTDDGARGRLVMGKEGIAIDWPDYGRAVAHVDGAIDRVAVAAGARYRPIHPELFGVAGHVTVHPLGGCPMGDDSTVGVVDDACAVFDPSQPDRRAVHDGLFVCDGAVLPRAVGKNPAGTICVLAERALELIVARRRRVARAEPPARIRAPGKAAGFVLAEAFTGWLSTARPRDPAAAFAEGGGGPMSHAARAHFTIEIQDVDEFRRAASHPASVTGTLTSPLFEARSGSATASVVRGKVFLLTDDPVDDRLFYNLYELGLVDAQGGEYTLTGMKAWRRGGPGAVWGDGTQMPVDLFEGGDVDGKPLARGFLRMSAPQFMGSLRSYRARGERSVWDAIQRRGAFIGFSAARVASRLFGSGE
jgi:cholesterol oxidase